jgi:hypothetical protein
VHRVIALDGEQREVPEAQEVRLSSTLASGRYRVETELGTENVYASTEIELQSAAEAKAAQRLQAGRVTIKAAQNGGSSTTDRAWEVRDSRGQVVWKAGHSGATSTLLAPGRYVVRSEAADRSIEKTFELKAGEQRTVDLAAP